VKESQELLDDEACIPFDLRGGRPAQRMRELEQAHLGHPERRTLGSREVIERLGYDDDRRLALALDRDGVMDTPRRA
jgi:hypothetical protein